MKTYRCKDMLDLGLPSNLKIFFFYVYTFVMNLSDNSKVQAEIEDNIKMHISE